MVSSRAVSVSTKLTFKVCFVVEMFSYEEITVFTFLVFWPLALRSYHWINLLAFEVIRINFFA